MNRIRYHFSKLYGLFLKGLDGMLVYDYSPTYDIYS